MNKIFTFGLIFALVFMAGCSAVDGFLQPSEEAQPTSVQQPTVTVVPPATPTLAPTAAVTPPATPTATPQPPCVLDSFPKEQRFGVQLTVDKKSDTNWEFNPQVAKRVSGDSAHPELRADADLAGCPVIIEGRKTLVKEHHIWVLLPGAKLYLDPDGIFRAKEFSAWAYPSDWNLDDFSTTKPPIAAEFVNAKTKNMKANNYSWPIFVHLANGNTLQFEAGQLVNNVTLPNNCNFTQPSKLNVTGVYDPGKNSFDASIGADGCWTVAKIDGFWTKWQGAKDNIVFRTVEAWLMPSTWNETNIDAWIAQQ